MVSINTTMFQVYQRTDAGDVLVAVIDAGKVTGEKADMVREMLEKGGYPNVSPVKIIHGSYLWAEEVALEES
jgi:hypothetical protein